MQWCLVFMFSLFSSTVLATSFSTGIFDIEIKNTLDVMVKTDQGEVLWINPQKKSLIELIQRAKFQNTTVEIERDKDNFILSAKLLDEKFHSEELALESEAGEFEPSFFTHYSHLRRSFFTMRRDDRKKSQCYERAYVWAYDLWETQEVSSMKLFLFFTNKYIREYRFKWWYHVSPMSYLVAEEYVLDRKFSKGPLRPQAWTNIFMRNNAVCKSVVSYFDYDKDDDTESCFLIRSSMYYLGPNALKRRDQGFELTKWNPATLRSSRRRGFY